MSKLTMPQIGMGTFRLKEQVAYDAVRMALELGYRHIDTAQVYDNESDVGRAIADSQIARDDLFITTKVWNSNLNKASFIDSVKQSLSKLQLAQVDLLLIHWPAPENQEPMEEYLAALLDAKKQGLTRYIGVSNFNIEQLEKAMKILPKDEIYTNQVEVHPYLSNMKLRSFCQQNGIHVTGYMPFAVGKVLKDEAILAIAKHHQSTAAEVVIAWALAQGLATIPSSTKKQNLMTNLAGQNLKLSATEMTVINKLDRNDRQADPDFAPQWDI